MTQIGQQATVLHNRNHQPKGGGSKVQNKIKKTDIWQFLRFCVVGTSNAVIDFGVLNLLLWLYPTTDVWKTLEYNSIAVLLASTNSFFWNKYWTFQQRNPINFQEIYRFIVVASGTTLMNDTLMWLLGRIFPGIMSSSLLGANVLKLGAIIGTMSISFFAMRLWVFFQKSFSNEVHTLADYETKKLSALKWVYDVDTVITGAIKPVHNVDTTVLPELSKPKSSIVPIDTPISKYWRSSSMKTLIIIPTYNEFENLPLLLKQIFSYAPVTDVLIVDDNSPDGTGRLAEEIRKKDTRVHILHRPGKLGLGTAYIAGFKFAIERGYDAVFEMDADFSHNPLYLPDFLNAIEHADLVIGSRYIPGGSTPNWSFIRRLISGSGNTFARFMLGIPVHDCTGGFRCYRCKVLQSIDLDAVQSRGYAFQVELTYRVLKQGFRIVETPITFMDRRLGTSKMSRKIVIEAFTYVLRTRFSKQSFVRSTKLQSDELSPVTSSRDLRKEELSSIPTQLLPSFMHTSSGSTMNQLKQGTSSPTGGLWNRAVQQQFGQSSDSLDVQAKTTWSGAGNQGFHLESKPTTSSDSTHSLLSSQQLGQGYLTNSVWSMEPFRVLPSSGQSGNVQGEQGFEKQAMHAIGNISQQKRSAIVRVEVGKELGRIYEMCKESLNIGRIRESDIFLDDPSISRLHATLVSKGDGSYLLIDEGSANGTKVNGQGMVKYQRYPLRDGDKIQLGETVLVFAGSTPGGERVSKSGAINYR